MFRKAGLDDARHVAFSRLFGELDDVKPYLTLGRINRFPFDELFDVSNQEDDGSIVQIGSKREQMGRVRVPPITVTVPLSHYPCHYYCSCESLVLIAYIIPVGKLAFPLRLCIQPPACRILTVAGPRTAPARPRRQHGIRRHTHRVRRAS